MPALLSNATATGTAVTVPAGRHLFIVEGTFSGATVALQFEGPNGTMINVPNASVTANGMAVVEIPSGKVRASVTGGPPSGIYASLLRFVSER